VSRFVLLPAFPLDTRMWEPVAGRLESAGHEVLPVDIGGLGHSAIPPGEGDVDLMALQVIAAMHDASWECANIVGISMGGYVAMAMLRIAPERVQGLGLVSTRACADAPVKRAQRRAQAEQMSAEAVAEMSISMPATLLSMTSLHSDPQAALTIGRWISEQKPLALSWCLRAMASRPDSLITLRSAGPRPVVIVAGEQDNVTTVADAVHMQAASRDAGGVPRLVVVPNAGHICAYDAPKAVTSALLELT